MQYPVRPSAMALAVVALISGTAPAAYADEAQQMPTVLVTASKFVPVPVTAGSLGAEQMAGKRSALNDTAQLLSDVPGMSLAGGGAVSSLPVIHGLADDRNRIKIDGMDLISACANHMNPPLSYIDPANVGNIKVYTSLIPVSLGGDSIGGAIVVASQNPRFAKPGEGLLTTGELGTFYRSNGHARGVQAAATIANENFSFSYNGATARSDNYEAARDFKPGVTAVATKIGDHWIGGDEVASSSYKTENHAVNLAMRSGQHLFEFKAGFQDMPYQGFPNQHMDMTKNRSTQLNFVYTGQFDWGTLVTRLYQEKTRHQMDFSNDKLFWYGATRNVAGMPMETKGKNNGVSVKADIALSPIDQLRVGGELQRYRLDDWWPPVANSMMMSPNTFMNINNGKRDRFDAYAEWEREWTSKWTSLVGLRADRVSMNAGDVQGYNTMPMGYGNDAARFNAADRKKTDNNYNLTALARYTVNANQSFEGGYARKARSPSLYERYTWSTNGMGMTMNNWINDGNGYVGDINLKPEVAHTLSLSMDLHDGAGKQWDLKVAPYFTRVNNYIDAACLTKCSPNRFNYLKVVNRDAKLYGFDLSGSANLGKIDGVGSFTGKGVVSYVRGKTTDGDNLYNIMPLNARLSVEHRMGNWTTTVEEVLVRSKSKLSQVRNEMETGGYGLLNLRTSYEAKAYRIDIGLDNALNKFYSQPLGGAYIGQGVTMSLNGGGAPYGITVPGMGRSVYAALKLKF
ncbi:TonB-dependent receptor [Massilia sp. MB5]|uniref:TonB-dependent receptor plug domain-containing protein n=1 Tax=Massilia sp. MB5 TaxID=2919578 RepID=UPI001F0CFA64|nr:TonB-dependent receptor [Massilia sp. MB5]UMR31769.1 TonB-dependent receptor [Massilia sp. MB5]